MVSHSSTEEEREFERHHIALQRDRYIATDVLQKVRTDRGYAEKVSLIEGALKGVEGLVLDVGSNTCGEAEVLSARGYQIIGMDINEIALGISRERVRRFGRSGPEYVAGDAQYIPLQDGAISTVVCYDALHHLPEPRRALEEIHRVLIPAGRPILLRAVFLQPLQTPLGDPGLDEGDYREELWTTPAQSAA